MSNPSHTIKALIFDFGGVLLRTMSPQPRDRLAARFGLSRKDLESLVFDSEESQLEQLGRMPANARWRGLAQDLGLQSQEEVLAFQTEFFSADALDAELIAYLRRMRGPYKTALLSNAWANLEEWLRTRLRIDDCFDVIVVSALVHMMKPDPAIYHYTLSQLQVAPQEAVFVDDSRPNVEAAAALGIHAIQFTTRGAVLQQLDMLLQGLTSHSRKLDKVDKLDKLDHSQLPAG
jgi:epoxide hydrolase-like predicted phosphatase